MKDEKVCERDLADRGYADVIAKVLRYAILSKRIGQSTYLHTHTYTHSHSASHTHTHTHIHTLTYAEAASLQSRGREDDRIELPLIQFAHSRLYKDIRRDQMSRCLKVVTPECCLVCF